MPHRFFGGAALAFVAAACAWTICVNTGTDPIADPAVIRGDRLPFAASRGDRLPIARLAKLAESDTGAAPFESRFSAAFPPGVFLGNTSFAQDEATGTVRSSQSDNILARAGRLVRNSLATHSAEGRHRHGQSNGPSERTVAEADAPAARPGIFERIFGRRPPEIFEKLFGPASPKVTLAYAAPTDGVAADSASVTSGLYDRKTAVYDISTHTVYMPNGTTLEAHSGLGPLLDQARFANERDRGPTPPDVYDLRPREALFHGVRALRLIPVDETKVFGRSGLLAHSYMLGPNGQSNGCVSFRDYDAFLRAYENHEITRIAVVSHID